MLHDNIKGKGFSVLPLEQFSFSSLCPHGHKMATVPPVIAFMFSARKRKEARGGVGRRKEGREEDSNYIHTLFLLFYSKNFPNCGGVFFLFLFFSF